MIIVDETLPIGDLPPPFPPRNVEVKFDEDMRHYYDLKKEIGRGRFGTVYLCTCKKMGLKFAAKFVNTKRNQDRENVEREIEIMKTLSDEGAHPKLIQLYDAFDMGKEMCLVLEVVEGGELFERVIDDDFELTERACAIFIKQICQAIEFIHSKNILHLDMKPENVLCLSREGNRIKICDFGLARKYDPRKKLQVLFGTPEFVAPEVVNFEPISFGTDMWSVGVICYVLLSGLSPFLGHNYVETMTNVTHNKYDFDDEAFDDVSDDVKDFIERLLILDKSSRLTPEQCYRHQWLRTLSDETAEKGKEIDKENLRKYMSKRRWNKALNTLTALKRMGAVLPNNTAALKGSKTKALDKNLHSLAVPTPLTKTSSTPNLNIILSEDTDRGSDRTPSPSSSLIGFKRCQSTLDKIDPLSNELLAKTSVLSRSSNQLDFMHEEYEKYYGGMKLSPVVEDSPNVQSCPQKSPKTKNKIQKEDFSDKTKKPLSKRSDETVLSKGVAKETKGSRGKQKESALKKGKNEPSKQMSCDNESKPKSVSVVKKSSSTFEKKLSQVVSNVQGMTRKLDPDKRADSKANASVKNSEVNASQRLNVSSSQAIKQQTTEMADRLSSKELVKAENCRNSKDSDIKNCCIQKSQSSKATPTQLSLNSAGKASNSLVTTPKESQGKKTPKPLNSQNQSKSGQIPETSNTRTSTSIPSKDDAQNRSAAPREINIPKTSSVSSKSFNSHKECPSNDGSTQPTPCSRPNTRYVSVLEEPTKERSLAESHNVPPNAAKLEPQNQCPVSSGKAPPLMHSQTLTSVCPNQLRSQKPSTNKASHGFQPLSKSKTFVLEFGPGSRFERDCSTLPKRGKAETPGLVDQLLSQFRPERRISFSSLKSVSKRELEPVKDPPKKRVIKPYICLNRNGLPSNSGSVREMARKMTTEFK